MNKIKYTILFLLLGILTLNAQTNWKTDKSHSKISFDVSHLVISSVTGFFRDYNITFKSDKNDFSDAQINFTAEVSSIDTDNEKRDNHLASADFFDSKLNPQVMFTGKSFTKVGDNMYKLVGDFTMRGVTKEIALDVEHKGTIQDPWGGTRAGFEITGPVNRTEFGLNWNKALETGGVLVGEEVEIICVLELIKGK